MLDDIKKILGFNNTQFDSIIEVYINAAKMDLIEAGIVSAKVVEDDSLIYAAIVSYVLAMFDTYEYRDMALNSYQLQKDQLRHYQDYVS